MNFKIEGACPCWLACYYSPARENKYIAWVLHCWKSLSHIHNISKQSKTTNSWTLLILVSTWTSMKISRVLAQFPLKKCGIELGIFQWLLRRYKKSLSWK
jgi:hypothetical protein